MTTTENCKVYKQNSDGTDQDNLDKEPQGSVAVLLDEKLAKKISITVVVLLSAFVVVCKLNIT